MVRLLVSLSMIALSLRHSPRHGELAITGPSPVARRHGRLDARGAKLAIAEINARGASRRGAKMKIESSSRRRGEETSAARSSRRSWPRMPDLPA